MVHQSVLLQEVVEGLRGERGEVILDATVGGGGHTEALCGKLCGNAENGNTAATTFVCLDADEDAIEKSRQRLLNFTREGKRAHCRFLFRQINYRHLDQALREFGISGINRAFFDLGFSSFQLEESGRGFSFMRDEPLLMTFAKDSNTDAVTAETILNEWKEETLVTLLKGYGEERYAKRIAGAIIAARAKTPIRTTGELRAIIESAISRHRKVHPATKTFQALRIAVNDEFRGLTEGLSKAWDALLPGGRIAVISFHSLEDRAVKNFFRELDKTGVGTAITKKPIVPSGYELTRNPRSRSAKLRILEKTRAYVQQ